MVFRMLRGVGTLGSSAREVRDKFLKQATIFGDPTVEAVPNEPNKAKIFHEWDGGSKLIVALDEGEPVPPRFKLGEKTFAISEEKEAEPDEEDKRYKLLMVAHSKSADRLIDRFGMKSVLRLAKWNSILDIITCSLSICVELAVSATVLAGVALAVATQNAKEMLESVKESGDSVQLALEAGVAGVGGFVIFAWMRRFLDDMQRILVDRVKIRLKNEGADTFKQFMELEEKYVEEEIRGPADNLLYAHLKDTPIIGKLLGHILGECYNIKIEVREIRALREMEEFISRM